jgi:hypothetical protein
MKDAREDYQMGSWRYSRAAIAVRHSRFLPRSACRGATADRAQAGISDPVNTVLAWYMARMPALYAAHGLKVEIVNMNGGSRGAAELQAGRSTSCMSASPR